MGNFAAIFRNRRSTASLNRFLACLLVEAKTPCVDHVVGIRLTSGILSVRKWCWISAGKEVKIECWKGC